MIQKFRKISGGFEAIQWNGENATEIAEWAQGGWGGGGIWVKQKVVDPNADPLDFVWRLVIPGIDGPEDAIPGQWIAKNSRGELSIIDDAVMSEKFASDNA